MIPQRRCSTWKSLSFRAVWIRKNADPVFTTRETIIFIDKGVRGRDKTLLTTAERSHPTQYGH